MRDVPVHAAVAVNVDDNVNAHVNDCVSGQALAPKGKSSRM
jgi:hypothetical protein